jgi:uncharacterized protein
MKTLNLLTFILVIVGAVNWTIFGLMGTNLITAIFGDVVVLTKLVYFLIGLSGLHLMTYYHNVVK